MTEPVIRRCSDGHFRRIIYGIGPYIADYPEQAMLACVVQGWCPMYESVLCSWIIILLTHILGSCYANARDIDGDPDALERSKDHRIALQDYLTVRRLWDDYGIGSEVIVSCYY
jgi:hypothetical protein